MPSPHPYNPSKYDTYTAGVLLLGMGLMVGGEYLFTHYHTGEVLESYAVGLYTISGVVGGLILAGLAYIQYSKQKEYLGHRWLGGASFFEWSALGALLAGGTFLLLNGLLLHTPEYPGSYLFWAGIGFSIFGAMGLCFFRAFKLYENGKKLGITEVQQIPEANNTPGAGMKMNVKTGVIGDKAQINWSSIEEAYVQSSEAGIKQITVTVEASPEKKVNRIRTMLSEMMNKQNIQIITYVPFNTQDSFTFQREAPSNGREYFSLSMGAENPNGLKLQHLNYLIRNSDLLKHLCRIEFQAQNYEAEKEAYQQICSYLSRHGYGILGGSEATRYEKTSYNPYIGSLDLGSAKEPEKSILNSLISLFQSKIPAFLRQGESRDNSPGSSRRESISNKLIDIFFNITEAEKAEFRKQKKAQKKAEDKTEEQIENQIDEELSEFIQKIANAKTMLSDLPGTKEAATREIKAIWKARGMLSHPDKVPENEAIFKRMSAAYEQIKAAIEKGNSWGEIVSMELDSNQSAVADSEDEEDFYADLKNSKGYFYSRESEALQPTLDYIFDLRNELQRKANKIVEFHNGMNAFIEIAFFAGIAAADAVAGDHAMWSVARDSLDKAKKQKIELELLMEEYRQLVKEFDIERYECFVEELKKKIDTAKELPEVAPESESLKYIMQHFNRIRSFSDKVEALKQVVDRFLDQYHKDKPLDYVENALSRYVTICAQQTNATSVTNPIILSPEASNAFSGAKNVDTAKTQQSSSLHHTN